MRKAQGNRDKISVGATLFGVDVFLILYACNKTNGLVHREVKT